MTIPQRTEGDVTIPILDIDYSKKLWGVWSTDEKHVEELQKKGSSWTGKARNIRLCDNRGQLTQPQSATAAKTKLWIVTVCACPTDLDNVMGAIFHEALSPLGFNQQIKA